MESNDTELPNDLRDVWALVTAQPGISSRAIAAKLGITHHRALKLIDILLASGNLAKGPGKIGTLRATVPLIMIGDDNG